MQDGKKIETFLIFCHPTRHALGKQFLTVGQHLAVLCRGVSDVKKILFREVDLKGLFTRTMKLCRATPIGKKLSLSRD
jgi:hypothetical protein